MTWVRVHTDLANWPGAAGAPRFHISSDVDGSAVLELAWDPQALMAPALYPEPLRYYTTALDMNAATTDANGAARQLSVPAQTIAVQGGVATWTMPADLWTGYVQEALETLAVPPATTFSANLYYRVRLTPAGRSDATIWPTDEVLTSTGASAAPRLGVLVVNVNPGPGAIPDPAALAQVGGVDGAPTLWSDTIAWYWANLPGVDDSRRSLAAMFAHPLFTGAAVAQRASLLKLWLFAGPGARGRITDLLDRTRDAGGGPAVPIVTASDHKEGRSLVLHLLDLVEITPHPDLIGVQASEQIVDDVITEILDPNGQLNLAGSGNCTPTASANLLISINPAEYARLQVGLLSVEAKAALANGDELVVPAGVFAAGGQATAIATNVFVLRTNAELAFQASVLAYGQGSRFPRLSGDPATDNGLFQVAVAAGMTGAEAARALSALFGVTFSAHQAPWPPQPESPVWSSAQAAIGAAWIAEVSAKGGQVIGILFWGQPPGTAADATQAVVAVRRDNGKVFIADLQYPGSMPPSFAVAGGTSSLPPRRYEDPGRALESIAEADVGNWIVGYLSPDSTLT
jgi:hypothetical protein